MKMGVQLYLQDPNFTTFGYATLFGSFILHFEKLLLLSILAAQSYIPDNST
jgi:hypothetical protein